MYVVDINKYIMTGVQCAVVSAVCLIVDVVIHS